MKSVLVVSIDKRLHEKIEEYYLKTLENELRKKKKTISKSAVVESILYAGLYSLNSGIITEDTLDKVIKQLL